VSRLADLLRHRASLLEIREIMSSMKTLAYLETRKLSQYREAQAAVVENLETAASDLLHFHPRLVPPAAGEVPVRVLLGSERGFCGNFNQALVQRLAAEEQDVARPAPRIVAVGHKLHSALDAAEREAIRLGGAGVADEVGAVLGAVVEVLDDLQARCGPLDVACLYHAGDDRVAVRVLLPPFAGLAERSPGDRHPPMLFSSPESFWADLVDHYLLAALQDMLYASLMAENHRRITHLEGAVRQLDDETAALARRGNVLRQEEIINEIEVILLSASTLDEPRAGAGGG
jgi:F-type H+-transporting ATPase subunit gamma